MLEAGTINQALVESLNEQIKVYPCHNLRASNLGHPCERYLYLLIKHWDEQKPHDAGLQSIFNLGNCIEDFTIENIKRAGFEVVTPTQYSFKIEKPYISGREDVRIKDPETGELIPVEIKGLSPVEWSKLNSVEDFFNSKRAYVRGYPAQLQVYMYYFAKEYAFFALTNKLTGETKFIKMPFDYEYAESLLQKAERIYAALDKDEPPEPCDDVSVCEGCSLAHVCGECRRVPAEFELDDELDELIARKNELAAAKREYEDCDKQIKARVGEREKVITGKYLITRTSFHKKAYTVPESTQWRVSIKPL